MQTKCYSKKCGLAVVNRSFFTKSKIMFSKTCAQERKSIYGIIGSSQVGPNQVNATNGTAFMIMPGVLVTAAHLVHIESDITKPVHQLFEVICATEIGKQMDNAFLIAEDAIRDVALIQIGNPRTHNFLNLSNSSVDIGTTCGLLGFPLAQVQFTPQGKSFNLFERFQGANISASYSFNSQGRNLPIYETDTLMYDGSSGCPVFTVDGTVIGMQVASMIADPKAERNHQNRIAISILVPSFEIIQFANAHGIQVQSIDENEGVDSEK